jgi:ornithine carbamoyltransferase
MTVRHYMSVTDLSRAESMALLRHAMQLKAELRAGGHPPILAGKTLAMPFEKPSLRTRVAFEAGMAQLGGQASYLAASDIDMGGRESVADVARNLSRWVDAIAARVFSHHTIETLASFASIPVINALSDREHPCQALADMLTLHERFGRLEGLRLAYLGDGNNVCHSLLLLGALIGVTVAIACPPDYRPDREIVARAEALAAQSGASVLITESPQEAVAGAHALYTDVWASMGQEHEAAQRRPVFRPYQLNAALLAQAGPGAVAMHCLPAHRGEEISADVIDGPASVIFDQAENRLHVQKALILSLLGLGRNDVV